MRSLARFASLLLLLAPAAARAQEILPVTGLPAEDPVCAAILAEAARDNQVTRHLDELVNGIGPRLTSSSQLTAACEWAAQRFRDFGVPEVRLERWGEFPVGFDRHHMAGRVLAPAELELDLGTRSWLPGTDGPQRGRIVRAPEDEAGLAALRGQLGGAWVLLGRTRPRFDRDGDEFAEVLGRFLDAEGILGTLAPSRGDLVMTSGDSRISWDALPNRVQVNLRRDQANQILGWLEDGQEVVIEIDLDQEFVQGPIPLVNVIAEIPGAELPEELVIFGGHIDSWDGATGTNDNGTGCATTLEAARLIMKALAETGQRPRRTIRFMLWSGEEQGLLGSRAYIEQHPEENERISGVLVHDGGTNALSGLVATPSMMPMLREAFVPIATLVAGLEDPEFRWEIREVPGLPRGIGSDHDSYLRAGVPGFFWEQHGESDYDFVHHTQHDTFESASERYQLHSAKVVALAAWRLGAARQLIPRDEMAAGGGEARPRGRRLGVSLKEDGLVVDTVTAGSLAAQAGWQPGDRILSIDGTAVATRAELANALRAGAARKAVVIQRGEQTLSSWFDWN